MQLWRGFPWGAAGMVTVGLGSGRGKEMGKQARQRQVRRLHWARQGPLWVRGGLCAAGVVRAAGSPDPHAPIKDIEVVLGLGLPWC